MLRITAEPPKKPQKQKAAEVEGKYVNQSAQQNANPGLPPQEKLVRSPLPEKS